MLQLKLRVYSAVPEWAGGECYFFIQKMKQLLCLLRISRPIVVGLTFYVKWFAIFWYYKTKGSWQNKYLNTLTFSYINTVTFSARFSGCSAKWVLQQLIVCPRMLDKQLVKRVVSFLWSDLTIKFLNVCARFDQCFALAFSKLLARNIFPEFEFTLLFRSAKKERNYILQTHRLRDQNTLPLQV